MTETSSEPGMLEPPPRHYALDAFYQMHHDHAPPKEGIELLGHPRHIRGLIQHGIGGPAECHGVMPVTLLVWHQSYFMHMHRIGGHTLNGSSDTSPLKPARSERASSHTSTTPCIVVKAESRHARLTKELRSQNAPLRGMHQEMSARLYDSAHHEVHLNNHTHCPRLGNVQDAASC